MIVSDLFRVEMWVIHLLRYLEKVNIFKNKKIYISKEANIKTKEHGNRHKVNTRIRKRDNQQREKDRKQTSIFEV